MKYIYMLSSCDNWKSWDSMRPVVVTTSIRKVRAKLREQIAGGHIAIGNKDMFRDWLKGNYISCPHGRLNDILTNGHLEVWKD